MAYGANTNVDNERNYLNSVMSKGGGYAEWAKNQLKELDSYAASVKPTTPAAPASPVKESAYYTPQGDLKTGYNIGGKTYTDAQGTNRLDKGNYTNVGGKWYVMGDTGGVELGTMPTFKQETPKLELPELKPFSYKDFSYDVNNDDIYKQYAEQFARQGQAAGERSLANTAAATGGMPSSFAAAANAQAQQAYAKKTADIIPELEQNAYNRYANERSFSYQDYLNNYNANMERAGALYNAGWDKVNYADSRNDLSFDRQKEQEAFDYKKYLDNLDNQYRTDTFNWQKDTDSRDFEYGKSQDAIRNSISWANYGLSKDDNDRAWEQFNYNKTQDELARAAEKEAEGKAYNQYLREKIAANKEAEQQQEEEENIRLWIADASKAKKPSQWLNENVAYMTASEREKVIGYMKSVGLLE